MKKCCKNCKYSSQNFGCICNDWRKCLGYSEWKPSDDALNNARKEIMDILHDMAKRHFNIEVFEKYDPNKPEYLTVNFVRARDWKHQVVTTMAFDILKCEIDSETWDRIADQIRDDLAELNDGYYLENMDVNRLYPRRMIKTNWENHWPKDAVKQWLNYQYGQRIWDKKKLVKLGFTCDPTTVTGLESNEIYEYLKRDVETTKDLYEAHVRGNFNMMTKPEIKKVIFNDPATIVIWKDDSKTVVKAQNGEKFDPEKGLAMAISKKVFGNQGNYFEEFKKWLPEEKVEAAPVPQPETKFNIGPLLKAAESSVKALQSLDMAFANLNEFKNNQK